MTFISNLKNRFKSEDKAKETATSETLTPERTWTLSEIESAKYHGASSANSTSAGWLLAEIAKGAAEYDALPPEDRPVLRASKPESEYCF